MDAIFWTVYVRNLDIHFLLTYEAKRFDFKYYVMSKISSWSTFVNHTSMLNVLRSFHHSHIIVRIIYNRNRLFRNQFQPCNIRLNGERVVCIVNHKSRFCLIRFFYIFLLQIINFYFFITTSFGIKSSQTSGFFKRAIRHFTCFCFHKHMRTRHAFCMEPPVIDFCKFEGKLIILEIVFTDIDVKSIGRTVMIRFALALCFLFRIFVLDITALHHFFLDLL